MTQSDFQISESISGVNMRLDAGGIRELHWHLAGEWAYMSYGNCRITVLDPQGQAYVADVKEGDLWYFPSGYPHSLQGLGPDGCEFILCFDDGKASEFNTLLVTDWMIHTPPDVLALNFGMPAEAFSKMATHNLWIFQGTVPGSLAADQDAIKSPAGAPPNPFVFSLGSGPVARQTKGGFVQLADSSNFKASTTIAAALVTVHPGGMREMHWHPNADEWQYYVKGTAQMTVVGAGPKAVTTNFAPGDVGYIKRSNGHYVKNTGDTDLVFLRCSRPARTRTSRCPTGCPTRRPRWSPRTSTCRPRTSPASRTTSRTWCRCRGTARLLRSGNGSFPLRSPPARPARRRVEVVGLGADPGDEARQLRVVAQRRRVGEMPGDLGFRVAGVDGGMADLVQPHGAPVGAALKLGGQVVEGGPRLQRDGPAAQGAPRGVVVGRAGDVRCDVVLASHTVQVGAGWRL